MHTENLINRKFLISILRQSLILVLLCAAISMLIIMIIYFDISVIIAPPSKLLILYNFKSVKPLKESFIISSRLAADSRECSKGHQKVVVADRPIERGVVNEPHAPQNNPSVNRFDSGLADRRTSLRTTWKGRTANNTKVGYYNLLEHS